MKITTSLAILVASMSLACTSGSQHLRPGQDYALADWVQPVPRNHVLQDSAWHIWCGSMIRGYDGKYHLYYSRWPRSTRHEAWITHSQIAYAVADRPEGPYRFVNVPLPELDGPVWDASVTHNPYILKHDGKYYLYYIGSYGDSTTRNCGAYSEEWWIRRNRQRIGVAVADDPAGPWQRFDRPVLANNEQDSTAFDALCVTNPAVCIGRDNRVVMLYKAVCKNGTISGGVVRFSVAFADRPEGPFEKSGQLIFQPEDSTSHMVAEDPYIWYDSQEDTYYAIVRDVVGLFTGEDSGGLALMQSPDALHWEVAPRPKVLSRLLTWDDGTTYDAKEDHVERPFLYFNDNGDPELLFGAFSIHRDGVFRDHSFNGWIPLAPTPASSSASEK